MESAPGNTCGTGIFDEMQYDVYTRHEAVNKSRLDVIARSPFHFFSHFFTENITDRDTADMAFGRAFHSALLTPELFDTEFIVAPEQGSSARQWREFRDDFVHDENIISSHDYLKIMLMKEAVAQNKWATQLLAEGKPEQSIFWTDAETGVACKCRVDWLCLRRKIIVDIKTTFDASRAEFARSCLNHSYDVQAAMYSQGVRTAAKLDDRVDFVLLVCESVYPYPVALYQLSDDFLQHGERRLRSRLRTYKECLERNIWPQYTEKIETLELPRWARKVNLK